MVLFVAFGCAAWCAQLAENRGRNPVPFGILGLFTGVLGVIIVACLRATPEAVAARMDAVDAVRAKPTPAVDELAKLADLHRAGELDDVEYAAAKRRMLGL